MGVRIEKMIQELSEVFEGEPWYGQSVMRKLENVPYKIGYKTCIPESHNVAQIIGHLIAWKSFALEKLKACKDFDIKIDSRKDWPVLEVRTRQEWEGLKRKLVMVQSQIYELLEKKEDEFLDEGVDGKDYNVEYLLRGLIQHDIYHLGQVGLIESQLEKNEQDKRVLKA